MKHYSLAIFDVDGTLLDTSEGILRSATYTIEKFNLPLPGPDVLRSFIGPPIQDSFLRTFDLSKDALKAAVETFRKRYSEEDLLLANPYEGIYETLENLLSMGTAVAIATYKREDYALKILKHFGFDRFTRVMFGADGENRLKKRDIISLCLKECGVGAKDAVMVGDTNYDAQGARELGLDFCAVTYGFGFRLKEEAVRAGAIFAAENAKEIATLIEGGKA